MRITAFIAWRPAAAAAATVASVPYDVVDRAQGTALVRANPLSFLRVTRPECDLPDSVAPTADDVYAHARERFQALQQRGTLLRERTPSIYLYRLVRGHSTQHGLVAGFRAADVASGVIRKHEATRPDKEQDRARHIFEVRAHTGLVFLMARDNPALDSLTAAEEAREPLYDFTASDGVRHTVWRAAEPQAFVEALDAVPTAYIADGHHRAAAAVRVAERLHAAAPDRPACSIPGACFPAVLFPASQLTILPYHRCVRDLGGRTEIEFLSALQSRFELSGNACPLPPGCGHVSMFLNGRWYQVSWPRDTQRRDPVAALDVSILQEELLGPLLGIADPRTDARLDFVGGCYGPEVLEARVNSQQAAVAFSMAPVTADQIMAIADSNRCMPPKSTWFEPKLRDGLLVYAF